MSTVGVCEKPGSFAHVVSAVVLNPLKDRTYFHLVYATRSDKGLQVFRQTERSALGEQADMRAGAQQRKREARGQRDLFGADVLVKPYIEVLRKRYLDRAADEIRKSTPVGKRVSYDRVSIAAMQIPTISEQDAKDLLKGQRTSGAIKFCDLKPQEVPKWGANHLVCRVR